MEVWSGNRTETLCWNFSSPNFKAAIYTHFDYIYSNKLNSVRGCSQAQELNFLYCSVVSVLPGMDLLYLN